MTTSSAGGSKVGECAVTEPAVGVIGLGVMGQRMLTNMTHFGGFRLRCGWDPDATACRHAEEAYSGFSIGDSAAAVIENPETDLVYIACPPLFHRDYALAAAAAGKSVLCEKPLGVDVTESRDLVTRIERSGVRNCVNFPFAEAAAVEVIETALKDGGLGAVAGVDIRLHFCRWPRDWQAPATWLGERAQGGFVRETFSHYVYLTQKLFGPMRLVEAVNRYPDDGVSAETHCLALFDCGGVPVTFAGGTGGPLSNEQDRIEFTVWGEEGVHRLTDWNRVRISDGAGWREQLGEIDDPRQDGYRRMLRNLARFLRDEPNTMPSFRDALAVQEVVEAVLAVGR